MTTNKRHILLNGYVSPENYRSRSNGRSPGDAANLLI